MYDLFSLSVCVDSLQGGSKTRGTFQLAFQVRAALRFRGGH